MSQRQRVMRSLQRELQVQRRDHPQGLASAIALWLLASAGLAGTLWDGNWQELRRAADRQNETYRGLLDLRVTSHRVIGLDWGHWNQLYRHAGGEDPGFPAREIRTSSIIQDGQTLLIVSADGSRKTYPPTPLSPALQRCLDDRLQDLQRLGRGKATSQAFGFYCPAGSQSSLGAGTAILPSGDRGEARGWLLHFSRIQRPSYNPAVNATFREIAAAVTETNTSGTPDPRQVSSISGLLPPGRVFLIQTSQSPFEQRMAALQSALLPWLSLNVLALLAGAGTLLGLRSLRLNQRRNDWRNRSRLRQLRQELPGPLLSQRELLETITHKGDPLAGCWIGALRMRVTMFSGSGSRSKAHTRALGLLGERLQRRRGTAVLALGEESNLLLIFRPETPRRPEEEMQRLATLLQELKADLSRSAKLEIQGLFTPLDHQHARQQLADLALVLSVSDHNAHPLTYLSGGVEERATELRQQLQIDFSVNELVENLREHRFELEPVMVFDATGQRSQEPAYSEMLFRLPEEMDQHLTVQEVILSLERNNNVHLIDQLMLRKAIDHLRRNTDPSHRLGINLSAVTFGSRPHFEELMAQLRALPEPLRQRLVLEITETAIVETTDLWSEKLQLLRDLGLRIAIDDFGVGFASIAYLFRFQADFLKLDLSYSQRLHDSNVDALVDFLLAYCSHNNSQLILEGIETQEQLEVWQSRGVRLFQGYLFHAGS